MATKCTASRRNTRTSNRPARACHRRHTGASPGRTGNHQNRLRPPEWNDQNCGGVSHSHNCRILSSGQRNMISIFMLVCRKVTVHSRHVERMSSIRFHDAGDASGPVRVSGHLSAASIIHDGRVSASVVCVSDRFKGRGYKQNRARARGAAAPAERTKKIKDPLAFTFPAPTTSTCARACAQNSLPYTLLLLDHGRAAANPPGPSTAPESPAAPIGGSRPGALDGRGGG